MRMVIDSNIIDLGDMINGGLKILTIHINPLIFIIYKNGLSIL